MQGYAGPGNVASVLCHLRGQAGSAAAREGTRADGLPKHNSQGQPEVQMAILAGTYMTGHSVKMLQATQVDHGQKSTSRHTPSHSLARTWWARAGGPPARHWTIPARHAPVGQENSHGHR